MLFINSHKVTSLRLDNDVSVSIDFKTWRARQFRRSLVEDTGHNGRALIPRSVHTNFKLVVRVERLQHNKRARKDCSVAECPQRRHDFMIQTANIIWFWAVWTLIPVINAASFAVHPSSITRPNSFWGLAVEYDPLTLTIYHQTLIGRRINCIPLHSNAENLGTCLWTYGAAIVLISICITRSDTNQGKTVPSFRQLHMWWYILIYYPKRIQCGRMRKCTCRDHTRRCNASKSLIMFICATVHKRDGFTAAWDVEVAAAEKLLEKAKTYKNGHVPRRRLSGSVFSFLLPALIYYCCSLSFHPWINALV